MVINTNVDNKPTEELLKKDTTNDVVDVVSQAETEEETKFFKKIDDFVETIFDNWKQENARDAKAFNKYLKSNGDKLLQDPLFQIDEKKQSLISAFIKINKFELAQLNGKITGDDGEFDIDNGKPTEEEETKVAEEKKKPEENKKSEATTQKKEEQENPVEEDDFDIENEEPNKEEEKKVAEEKKKPEENKKSEATAQKKEEQENPVEDDGDFDIDNREDYKNPDPNHRSNKRNDISEVVVAEERIQKSEENKLEDNPSNGKIPTDEEIQNSLKYEDINLWENGEKERMPKRERQALRWLIKRQDPKLFNILKKINIGAFFVIKESLKPGPVTKQILEKSKYLSKNGGKIENREVKAINQLLVYMTEKEFDENFNNLFSEIEQMALSGQEYTKIYTAKKVFEHINDKPKAGSDFSEMIRGMFGDLNFDGKLVNASDTSDAEQSKNVDKGTVMGGQIAEMYEDVRKEIGETNIVINTMSVIQGLKSYQNMEASVSTEQELIAFFKENPPVFLAFRDKLMKEPHHGHAIFREGKTYAEKEIQRIKAQEKLEEDITEKAEKFLKENPEIAKKIDGQIQLAMESALNAQKGKLEEVLTELERQEVLAKNEEEKENIQEAREKIKDLLTQMKDPSKLFLKSSEIQNQLKWIKLSGVGAALASIKMPNGERMNAVGAGATVDSEKINDWLASTKVFERLSLGGGVMMDNNGNVGLGLSLGLGGSQYITETTRVFYSPSVGRSPMGGGFQPALTLGVEQTLNHGQLTKAEKTKTLEYRSEKYIGVAGTVGLSDFAGQLYVRRDKLAGIEKTAQTIATKMSPIFTEIFASGTATEDIASTLVKHFPKERGDVIYQMAAALHKQLSFYDKPEEAVTALSKNFAQQFAEEWRNQNINKIIKEGWHLSQVGVGVSLAKAFQGFLGLGSLGFTHYKEDNYTENAASRKRAMEGMQKPTNFDVLEVQGGLVEKAEKLNMMLNEGDLDVKYFTVGGEGDNQYLLLDKKIFLTTKVYAEKNLKKQHLIMSKESDVIKIPAAADISLGSVLGQKGEHKFLALGAKSFRGTENIKKDEELYGTIDDYKMYETSSTKLENVGVTFDKGPNSELVEALRGEKLSDTLVNFRLGQARNPKSNYSRFIAAIKADPSGVNSAKVDNVKKFLPPKIRELVHTPADVRYVYASLSRVSQTRDKQLKGSEVTKKATKYLNDKTINLPSAQKKILQNIIVSSAERGLTIEEWNQVDSILHVRINKGASMSAKQKLAHLLAPRSVLIGTRTSAYERKIANEYDNDSSAVDTIKNARNSVIKTIDAVQSGVVTPAEGYIGSVAGYSGNEIDEKYVQDPRLVGNIAENTTDISDNEVVRRNYFSELEAKNTTLFAHIKNALLQKLRDGDMVDETYTLSDKAFIDSMANQKIKIGETEHDISYDLKFGFFADCINEMILFGNLQVPNVVTKEVKMSPENKIYNYNGVVTNKAQVKAESFGVGMIAGAMKQEESPKGNTEPAPEKKDPEGKTTPVTDVEGLDADNVTAVNGNNIELTINGEKGTYAFMNTENGQCINYNGEWCRLVKQGNTVGLEILDSTTGNPTGKLLGFATPVDGAAPMTPVAIKTDNPMGKHWHTPTKNVQNTIETLNENSKTAKKSKNNTIE